MGNFNFQNGCLFSHSMWKKSSVTGVTCRHLLCPLVPWWSQEQCSTLTQHDTNFTEPDKNNDSALCSPAAKSVLKLLPTAFPGVSVAKGEARVDQEGRSSPAPLLCTWLPTRVPHGLWVAPILCLGPSLEVSPLRTTNCYPTCVCFGHKRPFLHFSTKWSTWLRCDIIASWVSLPWKCLLSFLETGCTLICICTTC